MPSKRTELLSLEGEERATKAAIEATLDRLEALEAREAQEAAVQVAAAAKPAEPARPPAIVETATTPPAPAPSDEEILGQYLRPEPRQLAGESDVDRAKDADEVLRSIRALAAQESGRQKRVSPATTGEPVILEADQDTAQEVIGQARRIVEARVAEEELKAKRESGAAEPISSAGAPRAQVSGEIDTGPARPEPKVEPDEPKVVIEPDYAEQARQAAEARAAAAASAPRPPAGLPAQAGGPPRPPRGREPIPQPKSERAQGQQFKREAVNLWKQLQKKQQELEEIRKEMKKYKGLFGVRSKDKDTYEKLEEEAWSFEEDIDELKEDYKERTEEAAELFKIRPSVLRAEIEAGATGRRAAEMQERRPGLTPDAPARTPGEGDQEYLTRWQRVKDAAVSGIKFLPKMVWGVASTLLGVRAAETTVRFFAERGRLKKEKKAFGALVEETRSLLDREAAAGITSAERTRIADKSLAKVGALEERIRSLKQDGYLKDEDAQRMIARITEVVDRRRQADQNAQAARNQEVDQMLNDYFQRRASGLELGKQYTNLGFLLSGWQFGRAVTYGGLTVLQRAIRARGEQESALALTEVQRSQAWHKARDLGVLKDITVNASVEFGKGLTGVVWDIFKNKQTRRGDFARLKMAQGKAFGTLAIAAGFAKLVHAEATEIGPQDQIESVLQKMEKNGLAQTLGHNYLHNIDQLSFGLFRLGENGELKVADNPDEGVAKPAAAKPAAPPEAAAAPEITKTPEELAYQSALERLENASAGKIDFDPETGRVEIILGKGGYEHVQQALRDLTVLEKMMAGKEFTTVDAAQVENVVANLKYLLEGKDLRFMEAEDLDGIAHLGAGKLIIHDVSKFHELMQDGLLKHAADKITAGNLGRYDEVVATINNTSDSNWQRDVDVATGVSAAGEQGYVEVEIDREAVHEAEIEVARHETAGHEIPGLTVNPAEVTDEATYPMYLGKDVIPVEDGVIYHVIVTRGDQTFDYSLDEPIDIAHPSAGAEIKDALDKAYTEAVRHGVGGEATSGAAEEITSKPVSGEADFSELIKTSVAEGGLVGPDGYVHFGEVRFKPEWLDRVDDRGATEFSNDPIGVANIPWYMRLGNEALTLRALAETIKAHPDTGTVGEYIVKHQQELAGWMREKPAGPGGGISGV